MCIEKSELPFAIQLSDHSLRMIEGMPEDLRAPFRKQIVISASITERLDH